MDTVCGDKSFIKACKHISSIADIDEDSVLVALFHSAISFF